VTVLAPLEKLLGATVFLRGSDARTFSPRSVQRREHSASAIARDLQR
jgi:hypothetical protein